MHIISHIDTSELNPTEMVSSTARESKKIIAARRQEPRACSPEKLQTTCSILFYSILFMIPFFSSHASYSQHYQVWDKLKSTPRAKFASLFLFFMKVLQRTDVYVLTASHFWPGLRERKGKHCSAKGKGQETEEKSEGLKGVKVGTLIPTSHKARTMARYHSDWHSIYKAMA